MLGRYASLGVLLLAFSAVCHAQPRLPPVPGEGASATEILEYRAAVEQSLFPVSGSMTFTLFNPIVRMWPNPETPAVISVDTVEFAIESATCFQFETTSRFEPPYLRIADGHRGIRVEIAPVVNQPPMELKVVEIFSPRAVLGAYSDLHFELTGGHVTSVAQLIAPLTYIGEFDDYEVSEKSEGRVILRASDDEWTHEITLDPSRDFIPVEFRTGTPLIIGMGTDRFEDIREVGGTWIPYKRSTFHERDGEPVPSMEHKLDKLETRVHFGDQDFDVQRHIDTADIVIDYNHFWPWFGWWMDEYVWDDLPGAARAFVGGWPDWGLRVAAGLFGAFLIGALIVVSFRRIRGALQRRMTP